MSLEQAHIAGAEGGFRIGQAIRSLARSAKGAAAFPAVGRTRLGNPWRKDGIGKFCQTMVGFATPIPLERMHEEVYGYES